MLTFQCDAAAPYMEKAGAATKALRSVMARVACLARGTHGVAEEVSGEFPWTDEFNIESETIFCFFKSSPSRAILLKLRLNM